MNPQSGTTLLEVLVVVMMIGIGVGAAMVNLAPLETPLDTAVALTEGFLRQARFKAIANTSAYRVVPLDSERITAQYSGSCSATTWTTAPGLTMNLPDGVSISPTSWSACFSSRGISTSNLQLTLSHSQYGSSVVEVLVGGTTRIVP